MPGRDAAVVPAADDPLAPQQAQVGLELLPEGLVLVRVRVEQAYRGRGAFRGGHGTASSPGSQGLGPAVGADVRAPRTVMGPILRAAESRIKREVGVASETPQVEMDSASPVC